MYILGLAPNTRASIRFWYEDTLENFILKTGEHAENMDVVESAKLKPRLVSIGDILRSITVKSSEKWWENVPSCYETALFRAVISGDMYHTSVYSAVLMRIRAEAGDDYGIDYIRVGYLKAYLRRYYQKQNMTEKMEELTVSLNQKSTATAYSLGRLFAVMEALQQKANGDPDAGNMPRIDPETSYGIVTDVCIKRKIRDYVATVKEEEPDFQIYVRDGAVLNAQHELA